MKYFFLSAAIAAAAFTAPVLAADVGVSVSIGQPGFYGRIDIGNYPQPRVIYNQPVIVERGIPMNRPPLYLHVPPGHAKNWKKHCHEYRACGERVFFVRDDWYEREYVPRYQERHYDRGYDHHEKGRYDERGYDRRDKDRDDDRGNKGHGNKHDRD